MRAETGEEVKALVIGHMKITMYEITNTVAPSR
jgi:hypothetical protein